MTITLYEALDVFKDNIGNIEHAMKSNLQDDLAQEQEDSKQLGTGWVADEVRKLRIEQKLGDHIRRLQQVVRYREALQHPRPNQITQMHIERARSVPIGDLYAGKLHKHGGKMTGLCPFHTEKTPSFSIDTKKNVWYCFGACQKGGDAISYYMSTHKVDFIKAVRQLSNCG